MEKAMARLGKREREQLKAKIRTEMLQDALRDIRRYRDTLLHVPGHWRSSWDGMLQGRVVGKASRQWAFKPCRFKQT